MPITVTIAVTLAPKSFVQILGPSGTAGQTTFNLAAFTPATLAIVSPPNMPPVPGRNGSQLPLVKLDDSQNLIISGPVNLKFSFPTASTDVPALPMVYPVGLSFYSEDPTVGSGAASAILSLPRNGVTYGVDSAASGSTNPIPFVQVQDTFSKGPSGDGPNWKYYIIIQDNFGSIGVIDPDIENNNNLE